MKPRLRSFVLIGLMCGSARAGGPVFDSEVPYPSAAALGEAFREVAPSTGAVARDLRISVQADGEDALLLTAFSLDGRRFTQSRLPRRGETCRELGRAAALLAASWSTASMEEARGREAARAEPVQQVRVDAPKKLAALRKDLPRKERASQPLPLSPASSAGHAMSPQLATSPESASRQIEAAHPSPAIGSPASQEAKAEVAASRAEPGPSLSRRAGSAPDSSRGPDWTISLGGGASWTRYARAVPAAALRVTAEWSLLGLGLELGGEGSRTRELAPGQVTATRLFGSGWVSAGFRWGALRIIIPVGVRLDRVSAQSEGYSTVGSVVRWVPSALVGAEARLPVTGPLFVSLRTTANLRLQEQSFYVEPLGDALTLGALDVAGMAAIGAAF